MKIDIDEISPVQRKIRVELPAETVASEFSRAYEDLRRRVRIKGFRAGKAPRGVLQGIYGDELKGQVQSQLVEESLGEVIKERGLQIVSRPEIEANDLVEGSPFSFSAIFEIKPPIEVKDYLGIEVKKAKLFVTGDQVDEALRRLQESHARLEPVENRTIVQPGDFITLDFEGSIAGKPFQGGKGENYFLEVGGGQALPQFEEAVIGLTQGVPTKIQVAYPENYSNNELAGKTVDFSVVVREIKQKVLPELDDDFAKDHGECGSLEELRTAIRTRLENELEHIQQEELKEQIIGRLIEACSFAPPPTMVERQTRYLMERYQNRGLGQGASGPQTPPSLEETRKTLEGRALRQVQATLLVEKISQLENIAVSDKEVQERVDNLTRAAGDRAKTVREAYSKPDTRDDLRAQMVFDRTLGFLLERALIKEVDAPATKVDEQGKKG
ncbi:MAG TPA: trigger factor [Candidatus Binatia bacterium]